MKLILDLFVASNPAHVRVAEELKKHHEIAYWVRLPDVPLDEAAFPDTVFHDYHDAVRNVPPEAFDSAHFASWSAADIASMQEWENIFLVMLDKFYPEWSVAKRYDFYYDLLSYWGGVLDEVKPDCVIFNGPPHQLYNLVLFAIARARGIRTLVFDVTLSLDRIMLVEDYRAGHHVLDDAARKQFAGSAVSLDHLPEYLRNHFTAISKAQKPLVHHFTYFNKEHARLARFVRRGKALWPFVKDGTILERAVARVFKMIKLDAQDEYERYQKTSDMTKPYIYVPLHYQPECTTSPQGGIFANQMLMVKMLSHALPEGWELYVKEHPAQWPAHVRDFTPQRYRGFYAEMAAIPGVRLVPVSVNTFELADGARATATATGTAGWESLVRGKCALVFGYPWYMHAPGVFRVSSVSDCGDALARIAGGAKPDTTKLFSYLSLLDAATFWGFLDFVGDRTKTFDTENEWKDMYEAIEEALRNPARTP